MQRSLRQWAFDMSTFGLRNVYVCELALFHIFEPTTHDVLPKLQLFPRLPLLNKELFFIVLLTGIARDELNFPVSYCSTFYHFNQGEVT